MNRLRKINNYIARIEEVLLLVIVLLMVLLSFTQVVLRNLFDHGIIWGDIFLRNLVLWVGFIGASLASKEERHINIDVFSRALKGRSKKAVQAAVQLFAAIISAILTNAAFNFVWQERSFNTILFADIPAWYFQSIIPLGFAMMSVRFVFSAVEKCVACFRAEEAGE
jgi:TRAP-type C4-dicarboxylate transport system permease small subunit